MHASRWALLHYTCHLHKLARALSLAPHLLLLSCSRARAGAQVFPHAYALQLENARDPLAADGSATATGAKPVAGDADREHEDWKDTSWRASHEPPPHTMTAHRLAVQARRQTIAALADAEETAKYAPVL